MMNLIYLMDLYSITQMQYYFEHILIKHEVIANNPSIQINGNRVKNRIYIYIYIYILQLLTLEIVGGSTVQGVDKDDNVEHVPKLESIELALVHCNLVNNGYQQASKVSCTFVPSKKFE